MRERKAARDHCGEREFIRDQTRGVVHETFTFENRDHLFGQAQPFRHNARGENLRRPIITVIHPNQIHIEKAL